MLRRTTLFVALASLILVLSAGALAADNLLVQPKFIPGESAEELPEGWVLFSGEMGTHIYLEEVAGGNYVVVLDTKGERNSGLRSQPIPAKPGEIYTAAVEVNADWGNRAGIFLDFWNAEGVRVKHASVYTSNPGSWETLQVSLDAPEGTEYVSIIFYANAAQAPGQVRYRNPVLVLE